MTQTFTISSLFIGIILLLVSLSSTPFFSCGPAFNTPTTKNPDNFGEYRIYPIIHMKLDQTRYFNQEWVAQGELYQYSSKLENAKKIVLDADARLNFGEVRMLLMELSQYKRSGIILAAERESMDVQPSPFQKYLEHRLYCGC